MLNIQHSLNPLHVYCRLMERGLNKKLCMSICRCYEILIYASLTWVTVAVVEICRYMKRAWAADNLDNYTRYSVHGFLLSQSPPLAWSKEWWPITWTCHSRESGNPVANTLTLLRYLQVNNLTNWRDTEKKASRMCVHLFCRASLPDWREICVGVNNGIMGSR